jgi:hypothetical protein
LKNSAGTTVASGSYEAGPGQAGAGGPDANVTHVQNVTLAANECYIFDIRDSYGDGLTLPSTQGLATGYKIKTYWNSTVVSEDGDYGDGRNSSLKTDATSGVNEAEGMISGVKHLCRCYQRSWCSCNIKIIWKHECRNSDDSFGYNWS